MSNRFGAQKYEQLSDTGAGNNKSFIVPDRFVYRIIYAHAIITTVAGGGSRDFHLEFEDDNDNEVLDMHAGVVQTAGETTHYVYLTGTSVSTNKVNDAVYIPLPLDAILLPDWTIRLKDANNIDVTDTINVRMMVEKIHA